MLSFKVRIRVYRVPYLSLFLASLFFSFSMQWHTFSGKASVLGQPQLSLSLLRLWRALSPCLLLANPLQKGGTVTSTMCPTESSHLVFLELGPKRGKGSLSSFMGYGTSRAVPQVYESGLASQKGLRCPLHVLLILFYFLNKGQLDCGPIKEQNLVCIYSSTNVGQNHDA